MRLVLATLWVAILSMTDTTVRASEPLDAPYIYILGVAQDAGYPQALCFKPHCMPGWEDRSARRGAVSLAVINPRAKSTYLFEASPDLPDQLYRLHAEAPSGQFDLKGIFLTHAHIGHYTGLMFLGNEGVGAKGTPVYAMPRMKTYLENNGPWSQLVDYQNISVMALEHGKTVAPDGQIKVTPFLVPHRDEFSETVGYRIEGPDKSALFIPDIDKWSRWETDLAEVLLTVDYAFLDATFYNGDELPGRDMSKILHPSVEDTMARLSSMSPKDKSRIYFIHFNHTNPLLDADSQAARTVRHQGFNVSVEGMRLPL